jgi:hypothetical protein
MKTYKKLLTALLFVISFLLNEQLVMAQKSDSAKVASTKKLVDSQHYIFYAESATPMSGRQRFLTPGNTVKISKDTVVCDLPYFGRVYTSSVNTTDGGIKFTSSSFNYTAEARKKGGWDVTIKTKDVTDTQTLTITIYENGKAYLQARSNNRQSISYNGYVGSPL